MKQRLLFIMCIMVVIAMSCKDMQQPRQNEQKSADIIWKQDSDLKSDLMTPEVLWAFGRVGGVEISSGNQTVLCGVSYYDVEQNKGNRELYSMKTDGSGWTRLTRTPKSEFNAIWRPDGKKIGYLSSESGTVQLWEINPDGSGKRKLSDIEGGIGGFKYAPDMSKILYISEVPIENPFKDLYRGLPKASGRVMDDLMYRHWDHWVDSYSHIFIAEYSETGVSAGKDIMEGEPWGSPLSPFGGMEQIAWSPDSKTIAYTSKKKTGMEYSISTNSDIYLYSLETNKTINMTDGMMGFDMAPVFSPDGGMIAWESMERDAYESDKTRLFTFNFSTMEKTDHTRSFDQNTHGPAWSADGQFIYFTSEWHGTIEIYQLDLANGSISRLTDGIHNYRSVVPLGDELIATRQSMSMPTEIFSVDKNSGESKQISFVNKDMLDQLSMGKVEKRWIKTTDNKEMLTWFIYPPHFNPDKKYPTLLYCQGGPQSMVSQFWSYRWNFQMMAANGYIIVAPNRRGLPGFGQEWNEQISGDYGGQNMRDYFSAIDAASKESFVDETRLGAIGASYGGFSVFWLAGNHDKRFKAFISHDGMFNFESQYLETEEMWFVDWDLGGPFWDKNNRTAQRSYANSPHKFVHKWDTPILIIHGELDYRITYTQGMSAFNAAVLRGVPAEFLFFPDENHWVLSPQNGILWQRTFFNWLDRWLK
ncbi:MAG: S9 family peptidase [Bacteroidota bacterium]|nr:S9 family peptidase [Bacteroidota bacterium]